MIVTNVIIHTSCINIVNIASKLYDFSVVGKKFLKYLMLHQALLCL